MKALVVIDMENEWFNPSSEYFIGESVSLIKQTNKLIDYARKSGYKIIFTTHIEKGAEDAFIEGAENTAIITSLHKHKDDPVLAKYHISPFFETPLDILLTGVDTVLIAGVLTNLCVRMMAEECYDRGLGVTIISDCCQAFYIKAHDFTLKDLRETRPDIVVNDVKGYIASEQ